MSGLGKSDVWKQFTKLDIDKVRCNICKTQLKFCGGTTNLWNHLKRHTTESVNPNPNTISRYLHKDKRFKSIEENVQIENDQLEKTFDDAASTSSSVSTGSTWSTQQEQTSSLSHQEDQNISHSQPKIKDIFFSSKCLLQKSELITKAIAEMISVDMLPITVVEGQGFKKLINILQPNYKVPCRSTIMARINLLYNSTKDIMTTIINESKHVALTTDCWSSRNLQSYITVSMHSLSKDWQAISFVLATVEIEEAHTAQNLKNAIEDITISWSLEDKIIVTVTDNAKNITKAIKDSELLGKNLTCFAHSLQLVVNKGLEHDEIKEIVNNCSSIVAHFHHSSKATYALQLKQKQLNIPNHKLIKRCNTRWNSTFYMLERLLEQKTAISAVLWDRDVTNREVARKLEINELTWNAIEALIILLKPFDVITKILSEENSPTVSIILPVINSLFSNFLKDNGDDIQIIKNMKNTIQEELTNRFAHIESSEIPTLQMICSFIDPRYKGNGKDTEIQNNLKEFITDFIQQIENESEFNMNSEDIQRTSATDFLFPSSNKKTELEVYLSESTIDKNSNPYIWWKLNEFRFPNLAKLARKYLIIPATSCPSERIFSTAGNIVSAKRNALLAENVDKLIFLNHNFKSK